MHPITPGHSSELLLRIQAYLLKAASRNRLVVRTSPFTITISESTENPYLNYAIPDPGATPLSAELRALESAFHAHRRVPRLEYIPDSAPNLEQALLDHGFSVESRTPLMICTGSTPIVHQPPEGFVLEDLAGEKVCGEALNVQFEAYGEAKKPSEEDVGRLVNRIAQGELGVAARSLDLDRIVAVGNATIPVDGLCEVSGLAVGEAFRRRGLATSVTSHLTKKALERGVDLPFLMAASQVEERMYARCGFETVGEVLHISKK